MDLLWYRRYRNDGGRAGFPGWETSAGLESWDDAPAPARTGKYVFERVTGRELPSQRIRLANNLTHWAFGLAVGAQYGLVVHALRSPRALYGLPFGAAIWGFGYAVLPRIGVYRPIWEYELETLEKDLGAHLVFGATTGAAFRLLAPEQEK